MTRFLITVILVCLAESSYNEQNPCKHHDEADDLKEVDLALGGFPPAKALDEEAGRDLAEVDDGDEHGLAEHHAQPHADDAHDAVEEAAEEIRGRQGFPLRFCGEHAAFDDARDDENRDEADEKGEETRLDRAFYEICENLTASFLFDNDKLKVVK